MHGSQTLRAMHYIAKSERTERTERTEGSTTAPSDRITARIPTEASKLKSNCKSSETCSKPPPIETSPTSEPSPTPPVSSTSHKRHKKKRKKTNHSKHSHAPLLIFPFSWNNVKDNQYENNKQFHKKSKPLPPRITIQHGMDHLLSPSKCSKRYLSAYCLNLHQLTNAHTLIDAIIKKCTPVIKQLQHINNECNKTTPNDVMSPSEFESFNFTKYPCNDNELNYASMILSPSQSPAQTSMKAGSYIKTLQLNTVNVNRNQRSSTLNDIAPTNKQIASSVPIQRVDPSIPVSQLDLVETRSCPDLDNEYNNMSDDTSGTPPSSACASVLLNGSSAKSTPILIPNQYVYKTETIAKPINTDAIDHRTKMRAYCIATIKHNIDIVYHWIYYYPEDFADTNLLDRLLNYINKVRDKVPSQNSIIRRWQKLMQLIQHRKPEMKHSSILSSSISNLRILPQVRIHDRKTSFQFTDSFFPPREMVEKLGGSIDLLRIHPALVADQLTLIDTEIFLQIRPREFTNKSWQNRPNLECTQLFNDDFDGDKAQNFTIYDNLKRQKIDAPNLLYMIDHVNRLSLWVATEILSRNTTAEMADLTKYFYVVAHRCLELCNIHTCTAIFGGICLQPLTRLRRLNRYLADDEQIQTLHHTLSEMVSSNHNYKRYRNFIDQWFNHQDAYDTLTKRPCIPFIPVVMKDLFQIQLHLVQRVKMNMNDESKCVDGEKHIDLGLLEKNCRHIRRVYETQQQAKLYANQLPADTDIQSKLRMNIAKFETHETLRRWSFEIQPKLTKEDKENLEMIDTLEEFGFL